MSFLGTYLSLQETAKIFLVRLVPAGLVTETQLSLYMHRISGKFVRPAQNEK